MNEPRPTTSHLLRSVVSAARRAGAARRFLHRVAVALSITSAVPSCDCDDTCSDMLGILFEKESDWVEGTYALDLEFDGDNVKCTFEVPSAGSRNDECDDDRTAASVEGVSPRGAPSDVTLILSLRGEILASTKFEPDYDAPKGWDRAACGAPCDVGTETVVVP